MMVSLEYNFVFNGNEAIISIFIAVCKLYAYDGFIGMLMMFSDCIIGVFQRS
jgi:hypothetical protein